MTEDQDQTLTSAGTNKTTISRPRTLDGFVAAVTQADGVGLAELDPLTTVMVETLNTRYRVIVLEPPRPRILIQGGEFFPKLTEARLAGATMGGSLLKLSWLGCGLRMEVCADGQRIVTSPVRSIEVQSSQDLPGPF